MLREDAGERAVRYLTLTGKALETLELASLPAEISSGKVDQIIKMAKNYIQDAKHYLENDKPVTSLACVAYAEGLLDALKYFDIAKF